MIHLVFIIVKIEKKEESSKLGELTWQSYMVIKAYSTICGRAMALGISSFNDIYFKPKIIDSYFSYIDTQRRYKYSKRFLFKIKGKGLDQNRILNALFTRNFFALHQHPLLIVPKKLLQ
jgi:hypothetical protein